MNKLNTQAIAAVRNCGGAALRKTRAKHDQCSAVRYYVIVEQLGTVRATRINRDTYDYINDVLGRVKCAYMTHIGKRNVQYTHTVAT